MKKLSQEKKLASFDNFRSRGKLTLDFLFATGLEAESAHKKISEAFKSLLDVDCFSPEMIVCQRTFLVGVSESDTPATVRQQIHSRYPELQLESENKHNIKVLEPKQCKNKDSGYRCTVFFSPALYEYIDVNLNNRFRMGNYETWMLYPHTVDRCGKCQSLEHDTDSCKARKPTCANCSGSHWTRKCQALESEICCINCKRSEEFKDNFVGHKASSSECPVYLKKSKNA